MRMPEASIDAAFAALLGDPRVALRPPSAELPVAEMRAAVGKFLARAPGPAVARVEELRAGTLPLRLYAHKEGGPQPVVVFFHGGGFVFGSLDTHDAICRMLAMGSGAAVIAVDYRLAPEHPFPAGLDDCSAAVAWVAEQAAALGLDPHRIALAGDSAGGQLAIATALRMPEIALCHLALLYPLIDPARACASQRQFAVGHMLTGSFLVWAWSVYATADAAGDPAFDLNLADLRALPPATIVTAQYDPLRDEGEAFADRLHAAGRHVTLKRYDGMIHGFAGLPQITPVAADAIAFVGHELRAAFAR